MSKTASHLQLKGFVGGADFDRKAVDNILERTRESRSTCLSTPPEVISPPDSPSLKI